ncbi:WUSCHEL-related homeobox 9-like [Pyrus x bretschneideri]|uniref:WUSCHEL-related homeobox 9-like n=1 Tax=Pyrus x bretschneideri TaxID=225117 RepID=UPI00202F6B60|nr:WUSCHEL-related homeobox 9-like [Pyrus x bretschneideri]
MASSNRHWPSMFKSKPADCSTHHQWQHDISPSLVSNSCHQPSSFSSVGGCEERNPEPKPRWNPKPEQIRILEAIFNSGVVNPPRDEIRKIRAQLQEYGQVGDANVFYWFQNRKSRSKHKLRNLHNSSKQQQTHHRHTHLPISTPVSAATTLNVINAAAPSSSSSSSEKSSPKAPNNKAFSMGFSTHDVSINSPIASVNQSTNFFQPHHPHHNEVLPESPFFFPVHQGNINPNLTQGFCFSELVNVDHVPNHEQTNNNNIGPCTSLLLSEIMNHGGISGKEYHHQEDQIKAMKNVDNQQHLNYNINVTTSPTTAAAASTASTVAVPTPMFHNIQGSVGEAGAMAPGGPAKSTVFINDVAFEVGAGPFNVREAFGDDAVLIHSSGQPVLTNEWGLTLHPLHHGSFYYLI